MSFSYKKFPDGSWTIVGADRVAIGMQVSVTTRNGKTRTETATELLCTLTDGRHVYRIERKEPKADPKVDLLAACQRILRAIEWSVTEDRMDDKEQAAVLRAAIAKAEGAAP